MPVLYRASFGYLLRHPWQLGLAILGICIGVAVMVAVDLANESSRKAFIMSMDTINGEATHQVIAGPGGVDESVYTRLRVDEGIRNIAPIVSGYIRIGDQSLQLLGVDVFAESAFRNFSAPGNIRNDLAGDRKDSVGAASAANSAEDMVRRFLVGDGSLLMSADTAADLGVSTDAPFEVRANGKLYEASLAGVIGGDNADRLQNLVVADIAVAQHWLNMSGKLTRIDVKVRPVDLESLESIRNTLPRGTEVLNAATRTQTTAAMSDAFMTNLTAMSLLALLVGIFLIYNSVAFAVLQRRDLVGVLRALGVTRAETFRLILIESVGVGIVGATMGLLVGTWLGEQLLSLVSRTISDHYFVVNVTNVSISPASLAKGMAAGLGATIVAAIVPAIEATSYQPRLALTRSVLERRAGRLVPMLSVGGLLMIAVSVAMLWLSESSLVVGLGALFLLILGFAFCIPVVVRFASSVLAPLSGRLWGTAGRLAIGGVGKTLSRTGVAIVALSIAVSATIGVSVMVESFRVSVSDWLGNTLQSDVYVGVPRGSLDHDLIPDLAAVPGVENFSTSRRSWLETASGRTRIIALRMAPGSYAGTRIRDGDPDEAWHLFDNEGAVLVSDAFAYRNGVTRGESIQLNTSQGPVDFPVAAVYESYDSNDGAIMMNRATYDRFFDDPAIDSIGLYLEPGANDESVMDELRAVSAGRQSLIMSSNARIRQISLGIFDRTFVITNVLYWLAVGVAVIGILGAMLALQLERSREFGVLRAIGMTPGQTGALVSMQTAFIGLMSGIAAIPLGLVMAWVLVEVINRRAFGWTIDISISPGALMSALALAVGAALVAGIYPAWHAANARPALAMREE